MLCNFYEYTFLIILDFYLFGIDATVLKKGRNKWFTIMKCGKVNNFRYALLEDCEENKPKGSLFIWVIKYSIR